MGQPAFWCSGGAVFTEGFWRSSLRRPVSRAWKGPVWSVPAIHNPYPSLATDLRQFTSPTRTLGKNSSMPKCGQERDLDALARIICIEGRSQSLRTGVEGPWCANASQLEQSHATMSHERYLPMTLPNKLAQLAEEAGEVVAAVSKTLRFGLDSENPELPDGIREKNRVWLKRELEDLKKAIAKVEEFLM
jgi:hypothetical protein